MPPSRTGGLPLLGAAGFARALGRAAAARGGERPARRPRSSGCSAVTARAVDDLLGLIRARPELAQPVEGAGGYLAAEIVYACTHEGAVRLDDVLARRTRTAIEVRDRGLAAAPRAAALMAGELGWDEARASLEVSPVPRRRGRGPRGPG